MRRLGLTEQIVDRMRYGELIDLFEMTFGKPEEKAQPISALAELR